MDIDVLLQAFEKILRNYPEFPMSQGKELLRQNLLKRRDFDAQDQALIEAILRDKDQLFEKSLVESISDYAEKLGLEQKDLLSSEEGQKQIVIIFISVLENLIDYYYHALLNSQLYSM